MILVFSIWIAIYLIVFLFRKHLNFGKEHGWPKHWFVGFFVPIVYWLIGLTTGKLYSWQILFFGFTTVVVLAVLKELYDKFIKKTNFSIQDLLITISAGFSSTFFFVLPILNN